MSIKAKISAIQTLWAIAKSLEMTICYVKPSTETSRQYDFSGELDQDQLQEVLMEAASEELFAIVENIRQISSKAVNCVKEKNLSELDSLLPTIREVVVVITELSSLWETQNKELVLKMEQEREERIRKEDEEMKVSASLNSVGLPKPLPATSYNESVVAMLGIKLLEKK